jgi:hypothetical protein
MNDYEYTAPTEQGSLTGFYAQLDSRKTLPAPASQVAAVVALNVNGDELKRCPHCAYHLHPRDHVRWDSQEGVTHYQVHCRNCGATGPSELTLTDARSMWNLRRVRFPDEANP